MTHIAFHPYRQRIFFAVLFILSFVSVCSEAQVRDSAIVWIDDKVMVVSSAFPNVLNMKTIQGFQTKKGSKYVTVLLMVPDSSKLYNIKVEATAVTAPTPLPDLITDIDDKPTETRNKYTLVWVNSVNAPWNSNHLGKTASYTVVKDGSLETTFDGYKVEWFSEKRINHGIAAVSIDGGLEVLVDLYDPRTDNPSVKVWTSPVLTSGVHRIKIRCTLTKSNTSAGTDTNIIHDYFRIYKKQQ